MNGHTYVHSYTGDHNLDSDCIIQKNVGGNEGYDNSLMPRGLYLRAGLRWQVVIGERLFVLSL